MRDFFERTFGVKQDAKVPVRIIVFANEKQFKPFRPGENTAAFYQPGIDRDYVVMGGYRDEDDRVAVHEFVHLLVQHTGMKLPVWQNEGTAELFSTLKPLGDKVQIGGLIQSHFYAAAQEKWIPLPRLLAIKHGDPEYGGRSAFYAESWALTHMLQLTNEYAPKYSEFSRLMNAGKDGAESLEKAFGKKLWDIELDLRNYLKSNDRFFVRLYPVKLEKSQEVTEASAVSLAEAQAVLANLYTNMQKPDEARAMLDAAAAAAGGAETAAIPEARAYLAWQEKKWDEARVHFEKAMALGAQHPKLLYDAARMTTYAGKRDMAAVGLLKKAIEKFPEWKEARLQMAELLLFNNRPGEVVSAVADIKQIEPALASRLFRTLAHAELALKRVDLAEKSSQRALDSAKTDFDKEQAQRLVAHVERTQRYEAAVKEADALRAKQAAERVEARAPVAEAAATPAVPDEAPGQTEPLTAEQIRGRLLGFPENEKREVVGGKLVQVDCLGEQARLHVAAKSGVLKLGILDPTHVEIRGTGQGTAMLTCGKGNATVVVEYAVGANAKLGTTGVVRVLEFK